MTGVQTCALPILQKAVKELAAAMPEMEVLGADANQQEALFLINDTTRSEERRVGKECSPIRCHKVGYEDR